MRRFMQLVVICSLASLLAAPAWASSDKSSVGLGFSLGASFPEGSAADVNVDEWNANFNWGFYVNIPVVWTFHITPSAELYRFGSLNATDVNLAFKFIVPAWVLDFYAGVAPGLTTVGENTMFNVGGLVGAALNLFSNLDLFAEVKYKILIHGDQNMRVLHANTGILWHF